MVAVLNELPPLIEQPVVEALAPVVARLAGK